MSDLTSHYVDIEQRIRESLPVLDNTLRGPAIEAVAARVRALTADEVEDDGILIAALARVAVAVCSQRPAEPSREQPALVGEARIVAQEKALVHNADRLDQRLIPLTRTVAAYNLTVV